MCAYDRKRWDGKKRVNYVQLFRRDNCSNSLYRLTYKHKSLT